MTRAREYTIPDATEGLPDQPIGCCEIAVGVVGRVELDGGGAHRDVLPPSLTDQSVSEG